MRPTNDPIADGIIIGAAFPRAYRAASGRREGQVGRQLSHKSAAVEGNTRKNSIIGRLSALDSRQLTWSLARSLARRPRRTRMDGEQSTDGITAADDQQAPTQWTARDTGAALGCARRPMIQCRCVFVCRWQVHRTLAATLREVHPSQGSTPTPTPASLCGLANNNRRPTSEWQ